MTSFLTTSLTSAISGRTSDAVYFLNSLFFLAFVFVSFGAYLISSFDACEAMFSLEDSSTIFFSSLICKSNSLFLALLSAKTSALSTTAAVVATGCLRGEEEPALEIACLFKDCYYYFASFSCYYSYLST